MQVCLHALTAEILNDPDFQSWFRGIVRYRPFIITQLSTWLHQEVSSCLNCCTNGIPLFNSRRKNQMSQIWRKNRRGKLENISPICQFAMFFWWCWMLTTSATALISSWRQTHPVTNHGAPHTRKVNPNPKMYILLVSSLLFFPLHVTLTFFDHISHSYCKKNNNYIPLCLFFLISILLFSHSKVSSLSLTLRSLASPLKSLSLQLFLLFSVKSDRVSFFSPIY